MMRKVPSEKEAARRLVAMKKRREDYIKKESEHLAKKILRMRYLLRLLLATRRDFPELGTGCEEAFDVLVTELATHGDATKIFTVGVFKLR